MDYGNRLSKTINNYLRGLDMVYSFNPIINQNSKILILGTIPGEESIRKNQYYANEKNQFWHIIYTIFNSAPDNTYQKRCNFLLKNKIALWDVLHNADRHGSLDTAIKNGIPNDFKEFLSVYQNINKIIFNGTTAESLFKKHFKNIYSSFECLTVPSSSPTPGIHVKPFEEKLHIWRNSIL